MKRFIVISLSLIATMSLIACGNSIENNEQNKVSTTELSDENENDTIKNVTQEAVELTQIYQVPAEKIYVNVPDTWATHYQEIESGFSKLYVIGRQINIAITADDTIKVTTLEQAQEGVFKRYIKNMQNYATIDELKVEKDSKLTVNGTEMYKFEGKLACHSETGNYELYTIGYSFIMDGIPCNIEGTVLNKSQPEDMINQVRDTVNAMAQTVRNTK